MRRIKKELSLFFVAFLALIFIFPKASALTSQTEIIGVDDSTTLNVGRLSFSNISFQDNSSSSALAFGLTADVTNTSSSNIYYDAKSYYYDSNNNLIATTSFNSFAVPDKSKLNFMSNLNVLGNRSVQDIQYYRLEININDSISIYITPSMGSIYSSYEYVIDKYDVNIVVNDNNTFDITETINANFKVAKHGIYRKIPLKNKIVRLDGTTSTNHARITNLSVNNIYKISTLGDVYNIQIGDPNRTLTGEQTYTIKYTYNIGKDPIKDYDELYYNIIGNEWDTVIGNITFSITMPKEFDPSKLGFSSGVKGSIANDDVIYNISDNTITGYYNGVLNPGEALTIRTELPEGYFEKATSIVATQDYLIYIIPIACLIISVLLWFVYGRTAKVVETVEFYPPDGLNSLEVGFLYKGLAYNIDVTSLLIYLANKGYIKITEIEETLWSTKSQSFKITKLKDYEGSNINEKIFLDGMFRLSEQKEETTGLPEVTLSDLYDAFHLTTDEILSNINNKENKQKIFEKKALSKKKYVIMMMLISYIFITIIPMQNYSDIQAIIFALICPPVGFMVAYTLSFSGYRSYPKFFGLIWGFLFGGIPWLAIVLPIITQEAIYLIGNIIGLTCIIIMAMCLKHLSKRTPYGLEMLGKIKGFKTYLETAEKDKLEAMVMQNPNYFYDILPYTYVLDVSDKWIKKFETITMQSPNWYTGHDIFSVSSFGTFMKSAVSSVNSTTSSSSSSYSGGSSGGGSSGGGSGGGGGGSW